MKAIAGSRARFRVCVCVSVCLFVSGLALNPGPARAEEFCDTDICVYVPPPPSGPGCQSCIPAGNPTVLISGVVADVYGTPIQGAAVYWDYGQVTSNELGAFTIRVWTNRPVSLTARRDRFAYQTITNNAPSVTWSPQFRLRYELIGMSFLSAENSNPAAANDAMQVITLRAYSTAPVTGTAMFVQFGPDQMYGLSFDTSFSNAPGWSRWSTTYVVPEGAPDGIHTFKTCALSGWGGTCEASTNVVLGRDDSGSFIVDRVAPSFVSSDLLPFSNVSSVDRVSLTFDDPLAGLASSGHVIRVDGTPAQASLHEGRFEVSGLSLTPGVHVVSARVLDGAGNVAEKHVPFTIVRVTGSSAAASLRSQTIQLNPGSLSPPSTVTFNDVPIEVDGYDLEFNASTLVGHSKISRAARFDDTNITFRSPSGAELVVPVPPFTVTSTQGIGTLSPSASLLGAAIASETQTAPALTVDVPSEFRSEGATATLNPAEVQLGLPTFSGQLFDEDFEDDVRISGEIGVCLAGNGIDEFVECRADQQVRALYRNDQHDLVVNQLALPTTLPEDMSRDGRLLQPCVGTGCREASKWRHWPGGFAVGCPTLELQLVGKVNLCSSLVDDPHRNAYAAHINAAIYREDDAVGGLQFPLWQQNHATVPTTFEQRPHCPAGESGRFSGSNYRLVTNVVANDGSTGQITAGTQAGVAHVYLGGFTGNYRDGYPDPGFSYQISNDTNAGGLDVPLATVTGSYLSPMVGFRTAANGQSIYHPSATTNGWELGPEDLTTLLVPAGLGQRVQIMTGTEYRRSAASGSGYNLTASIAFQAAIDFSGCAS